MRPAVIMTQSSHLAVALSILTGLTIAGCAHDSAPTANAPSSEPGTGVPEGVANTQNAADLEIAGRLATSRCERALACNDIGAGKAFVSRNLCMQEVRGNTANDLTSYKCPHGLNSDGVDRCRAAVDGESCGHSRDSLSHLAECKTEALCLK